MRIKNKIYNKSKLSNVNLEYPKVGKQGLIVSFLLLTLSVIYTSFSIFEPVSSFIYAILVSIAFTTMFTCIAIVSKEMNMYKNLVYSYIAIIVMKMFLTLLTFGAYLPAAILLFVSYICISIAIWSLNKLQVHIALLRLEGAK